MARINYLKLCVFRKEYVFIKRLLFLLLLFIVLFGKENGGVIGREKWRRDIILEKIDELDFRYSDVILVMYLF